MSSSPTPTPPTPKPPAISSKASRLIEISHAVHDVRREQAEKALQDAMAAEVAGSAATEDDPTPARREDPVDGESRVGEVPIPSTQPARERTTIASFVFGSDWAEKVVRRDYPEPTTPVRRDLDNEHLPALPRKGKDVVLPGRKRARVLSEGTLNEDVNERGRVDFPPPYQAPAPPELGMNAPLRQPWLGQPLQDAQMAYANANVLARAPPMVHTPVGDVTPVANVADYATHGQHMQGPQAGPHPHYARQTGPPAQSLAPPQLRNDAHANPAFGLDSIFSTAGTAQPGGVRDNHVVISAELYDALVRRQNATAPMNAWPASQTMQEAQTRTNHHRELAPYRVQSVAGAHWPSPSALPQTPTPGRPEQAHLLYDTRGEGMEIDGSASLPANANQGHHTAREDALLAGTQVAQTRTTVNLLIEAGQVLCTPRPHGGFPIPEGRGPFDALRHASASRLAAWKTFPPARRFLFDIVGKLAFTENEATDITSYVEGRFYQLTGERGAVLLPPEPRRPDVPKEDGPSAWMACGYSQQATAVIVEHGVLSYDHNNTYIVYSGSHPPPTYILTLEGLTQKKEEPVVAAICEVLAKEDVLKLTAKTASIDPRCPGIDPMTIATTLPRSLRAEMTRLKNNRVVAHVYLEPPTRDPLAWDTWRNLLCAQEYKHILLPDTVRVRPPQRCFACHAADHDVDTCPLPNVLGWRGPTLQDLVNKAETEPMPVADYNTRGNIAQPIPRWPQANTMRGAMHAGPSSNVPRSQRNPNRSCGRN
ncbi:hypothetical protein C2E23DRAFT_882600 [Lenzites betulinus]|nr:hypothetical protein C2E23DRAFT_882600 [Lenzites betulinus]